MIRKSIYISCLILAACSGEPEEEVVEIEDLIGDTGEIETDSSDLEIDTAAVFDTKLESFVGSLMTEYDTSSHDEFHSMDRFNFSTYRKVKLIGKNEVPYGKTNMVIPKAELFYYTFSDTLKTNNAFYNWLDCFGSDCNEVKVGEDLDAIKTPPMFTIVYDTTILVLEYMCEHEKNDWDAVQDSLIKQFGGDYKYMIDVDCGGPLKWK